MIPNKHNETSQAEVCLPFSTLAVVSLVFAEEQNCKYTTMSLSAHLTTVNIQVI